MSKYPKIVSFDRSAAYLHHRAMMNRRENRAVDALELLRRAVEAQPENSEYRLDLAELLCEMGLHGQSARLLLDMLSEKDAPSECFYGLALNQLGMSDLDGARQSLDIYRNRDPQGPHFEDVSQLAAELDLYASMNRPANRRLYRAMRLASRACDAMRVGDAQKACRLFRASLEKVSEQSEMRALYAMALLMSDDRDGARREVDRAAGGFPPSVRALGVCAQVYNVLGDRDRALKLMDQGFFVHAAGSGDEFGARLGIIHHTCAAQKFANLSFIVEGRYRKLAKVFPFGKVAFPQGVHPLAAPVGQKAVALYQPVEVGVHEFPVGFHRNGGGFL